MGFSGINTSYTAIRAAQAAINTTSHNIANATTEGFTRQSVQLGSRPAHESYGGWIGSGVDTLDISRQRDSFLDDRARAELNLLGQYEVRDRLLGQAETRFGELDAGIDVALSGLFASLEEWSLHPDQSPSRQTVLGAMDNVAARLRATTEGLQAMSKASVTSIEDLVSQVNGKVDAIAKLNREIVAASGNGSANDLLDARDRLVDDLSRTAGVTVIPGKEGAIRISIGGLTLVDNGEVSHLTANPDGTVTHPDGPVKLGGEIGGHQRFLTQDLPSMIASLDTLATNLANAFNSQNAAGFRMDGSPGGDLFDASGGAANFTMIATSPSDLAAAGTNPPAAFDGANAAALASLRTADVGGAGSLLSQFRNTITAVGVSAARADLDLRGQRALENTASVARESAHGVNLDEEMANLITFQRSLEAAARVMSAMDEALATLINRTGVVGR